MKHFKLMKGMFACLLTLALVVACFGLAGANAADTEQKVTVTLKSEGNDDKTISVTIAAGESSTNIDLPTFPTGWEAPENKVFEGWLKGSEASVLTDDKLAVTGDVTLTAKYKDAPKVTFTVNTVYGGTTKAYTYAPYLYKANSTITLEDILGEATNSGNTIEDPSAWIVNGTPAIKIGENTTTDITYNKGTFKVAKALTADATVEIKLAPAKINISFKATVGGKEYTSTFAVENGAKTKISYYDIAAGLKRTEGEEEIALEGQVVTKVGGEAQTGKYSASAHEVGVKDTIRTADFDVVAIEVADAFTKNSGYDPDTDSIIFESPVEISVYWADVKKSGGATLQPKNFKTIDLKKANNDATTYTGSLPLNSKDTGVKIAENKTAYIYASITAPAEGKNKYKANFVVDATPYKKVAVTFAYAQAQKNGTDFAISSITTTSTKKKVVTYSGAYNAETNPDNYLYSFGDNEVKVPSEIFNALQYSTDGTTWYGVNQDDVTISGKTVAVKLTTGKLFEYVDGGSKVTLYIRIKGGEAVAAKEATETSEAVDAKNAYRATKAEKAKITPAKAGKAVKFNASNGTLAIKNGYDIAITSSEKTEPTIAQVYTILPFNKDGKAIEVKDGEEVATSIISTSDFVPVKKVTENNKMFTNIKVKSFLISDIPDIELDKDSYIWIRKSASAGKPAEKWVCIKFAKVTAGPSVATVKGKTYYSAQDPADTKGTIAAPEIKNASSDKNSGAYEYLIVDAADYSEGKVDMASAVWTAIGSKGLTVGKSKSKYAKEAGKSATDHVLKDGSVVLIRRAGDKDSYTLASEYTATMIVKEDVTYKDADNKDQTKALYVWKAYSAS